LPSPLPVQLTVVGEQPDAVVLLPAAGIAGASMIHHCRPRFLFAVQMPTLFIPLLPLLGLQMGAAHKTKRIPTATAPQGCYLQRMKLKSAGHLHQ
jgi:hypothetical protein